MDFYKVKEIRAACMHACLQDQPGPILSSDEQKGRVTENNVKNNTESSIGWEKLRRVHKERHWF